MKISVVMSTYNGKKYIVEQLNSLRVQTKLIDEVIIYDDASNDNTVEIVKSYINQYALNNWKVYLGEKNRGYIQGFTNALRHATGDVIFLADQDDIWMEDKIEGMCRYMLKYPQILALNSSFSFIDGKGKELAPRNVPLSDNNGYMHFMKVKKDSVACISDKYILQNDISPGCTMAIRKELLQDYFSFQDNGIISHDWKLNFLAAKKNGCFFWNHVTTQYRIHNENTIGTELEQTLSVDFRIRTYEKRIKQYQAFIDGFLLSNVIKKKKYTNLCRKWMKYYSLRCKALRKRNILYVIAVTIYGLCTVGIEATTTLLDIDSIFKS